MAAGTQVVARAEWLGISAQILLAGSATKDVSVVVQISEVIVYFFVDPTGEQAGGAVAVHVFEHVAAEVKAQTVVEQNDFDLIEHVEQLVFDVRAEIDQVE